MITSKPILGTKSCKIYEVSGCVCKIAAPKCQEVKINWDNVSADFKRDFMENWRSHYELSGAQTNNIDSNVFSILDKLGYYINNDEFLSENEDFESAYNRLSKLMFDENQKK